MVPRPINSLLLTPNSHLGGRRTSPDLQARGTERFRRASAVFVGIDVSKKTLDIHILPENERLQVPRDAAGLNGLTQHLRSLSPELVVLEATGGFEIVVAAALAGAGLPVVVANPAQIGAFARALGRLAKTDRLDAEVIALFAERVRPEVRPLADAQTAQLAELVGRRRQLVEMLGMEGNRRRQARHPKVLRGIEKTIAALQAALTDLDQEIDDTMRGSPAWRAVEDLLTSVPGVGPITARTLIAELPELGQLSRRRVAALVGVAPINRDSGTHRGIRGIAGGRGSVRRVLYMATLVAVRYNPAIRAIYERLRNGGRPAKVALIAASRKLLTILNAILREKTPWQSA